MASRSSSSTRSPRTSMSSPSARSRSQIPEQDVNLDRTGGDRPAVRNKGRQSDQGDRPNEGNPSDRKGPGRGKR